MSAPETFPLHAVAALFLERQHLRRPRRHAFSPARVARLTADTGGLQIDSINVLERAHYLTVWSRFGAYDQRALDRLVYRRRVLFEYWAHAACLVPTAHFAAWRRAMLDYHTRSRGWARWLKKNRRDARARWRRRSAGRSSRQRRLRAPPPAAGEAGWWNWKPTTHALDYLWMSGRTLVHSRPHFQKRFDLAERLMPEALAREPLTADDFHRWHLRQSLHAMGAATRARPADVPDVSRASGPPSAADGSRGSSRRARSSRSPWSQDRRRRECAGYALAEDLPALAAAARRRVASEGTTLLSPFDSFLWHRERTRRLFGFDYRIEVYTPGHQRVHGYYTLPILHDGQLIGRVDPKVHRAERRLEVKHVHFEPWFARGARPPAARWGALDQDAALAGLADSLRSLAIFVGADAVSLGRVTPSSFRTPLRRRL